MPSTESNILSLLLVEEVAHWEFQELRMDVMLCMILKMPQMEWATPKALADKVGKGARVHQSTREKRVVAILLMVSPETTMPLEKHLSMAVAPPATVDLAVAEVVA